MPYIDFHGRPVGGPTLKVGLIGCGSHAFRNVVPTFQFVPVEFVATCDRDRQRAEALAAKFGARAAYQDHVSMLEHEGLDAVFIVTPLDAWGRPQYPDLAVSCLEAGCHVWIEKPPASTQAEVEKIASAAKEAGKNVMVGLKKMFAPATAIGDPRGSAPWRSRQR